MSDEKIIHLNEGAIKSELKDRYCQEFFAKTNCRLAAGSYPATESDSAESATSKCFMLM